MVHQYRWSWLWAIPPAVAILLNLKLAWRVPNRTTGDLIAAGLLRPGRDLPGGASRLRHRVLGQRLAGIKRDGWASQARAEQGASNGPVKMLGALLLVGLLGAGAVFAWLHAPLFVQQRTLTVGWSMLAVITALQVLIMLIRIVRPSRGLRP